MTYGNSDAGVSVNLATGAVSGSGRRRGGAHLPRVSATVGVGGREEPSYGTAHPDARLAAARECRTARGSPGSVGGATAFAEPAFHVRLAFREPLHLGAEGVHRGIESGLDCAPVRILPRGRTHDEGGECEADCQYRSDDGEGVGVHARNVAR